MKGQVASAGTLSSFISIQVHCIKQYWTQWKTMGFCCQLNVLVPEVIEKLASQNHLSGKSRTWKGCLSLNMSTRNIEKESKSINKASKSYEVMKQSVCHDVKGVEPEIHFGIPCFQWRIEWNWKVLSQFMDPKPQLQTLPTAPSLRYSQLRLPGVRKGWGTTTPSWFDKARIHTLNECCNL